MNEQLRAATLIEQLTTPEPTFDVAQARELISLIPLTRRGSPFKIEATYSSAGANMQAVAAGSGGLSLDGEGEVKNVSLGEPEQHRCGLFRLEHRPGALTIAQIFGEGFEDETGRRCRLIYHHGRNEPTELRLLQQHSISMGPLKFSISIFKPWKRAANSR